MSFSPNPDRMYFRIVFLHGSTLYELFPAVSLEHRDCDSSLESDGLPRSRRLLFRVLASFPSCFSDLTELKQKFFRAPSDRYDEPFRFQLRNFRFWYTPHSTIKRFPSLVPRSRFEGLWVTEFRGLPGLRENICVVDEAS